jgi:hypothetical protein
MYVDVQWVKLPADPASGPQPVAAVRRPLAHDGPKAWAGRTEVARLGADWVPLTPVLSEKIDWAVTREGEVVRVPMVAYQTSTAAYAALFGLGVTVGLAAAADLKRHTSGAVLGVTLVLGTDCHDLRAASPPEDGLCCYIGLVLHAER